MIFDIFLVEKTMRIGREIGEYCQYWFDEEIYDSIQHIDEKKQIELKDKYYSQCHKPVIIYKPYPHVILEVKCKCCDLTKVNDCNILFPKIAAILYKEFKELEDAICKE